MKEKTEMKIQRKILLALCAFGFACSLLLFVSPVQNLILNFGEQLVGRSLTRPVWVRRFVNWGVDLCVLFAFATICLFYFKSISSVKVFAKRIYDFAYKNEHAILLVALLVFCAINIVSIIFHEHWRDEAQSWLIAKYSSPLGLLHILPDEGHPSLFYLILMPFAKLGLNYNCLSFVTFTFVFVATILFVRFFKANSFLKIILIFSPIFMYFPGVIARSYCLIPLELVVVACVYKKRKNFPIFWGVNIALMLQTHIYLAGFCGMFMLQMLFDCICEKDKKTKIKILAGGIIATLSLVLLLVELGIGNSRSSGSLFSLIRNPISFVRQVKSKLQILSHWAFVGGKLETFFCRVILFLIILKAILNFKNCAWEFFILLGTIFEILVVYVIYPGGHMNHHAAIFSILTLCFFILETKNCASLVLCTRHQKSFRKMNLEIVKNVIFVLMLLASCKMVFMDYIVRDICHPFSNSKAMAQYINENFDGECNFVVNEYVMMNCVVSAYLDGGKVLLYPSDGTEVQFLHLGSYREESWNLWQEEKSSAQTYYLFAGVPYSGSELELVHAEDAESIISDERYFLYKKRAENVY